METKRKEILHNHVNRHIYWATKSQVAVQDSELKDQDRDWLNKGPNLDSWHIC